LVWQGNRSVGEVLKGTGHVSTALDTCPLLWNVIERNLKASVRPVQY